jgi:hypothetical protein
MEIPDGLHTFRANVEGGWGVGHVLVEGGVVKYLIRWNRSPEGAPVPLKWMLLDRSKMIHSANPGLYAYEYLEPIQIAGAIDHEQR